MRDSKFLLVVFLALFLLSPMISNVSSAPPSKTNVASQVLDSGNLVTPTPEPPHRIVPVSILVYTQYADTTPTGEYAHTMAAINDTYGTNYYYDTLTDYTNLDTALPGHDILLIVDQEQATISAMQTVGTVWASTLTSFVQAGGIVILMDYCIIPYPGYVGISFHIYNESGLIQINGVSDEVFSTAYLDDSSDALARGVAASWPTQDGTLSFNSSEGTMVVRNATSDPIVIHKIMGQGHIVLLGFDLFTRETNCDTILGNAIRLHRHVVFDESHSPYASIFDSYSDWTDDMVAEGFAVSQMTTFDSAYIQACDLLIIALPGSPYSGGEISTIRDFVDGGGGLFVHSDHTTFSTIINTIITEFGYTLENNPSIGVLHDTDDYLSTTSYVVYDNTGGNINLHNHSLTLDVSRIEFYYGTGFTTMPTDAASIITTDIDGTADWDNGSPADGVTTYAASTFGWGRVVISGEGGCFFDDVDSDSDMTNDYYDSDHAVLLANSIRWLSAAGLKERIVLFDESHNPYYVVSNHFLKLANFLTCNGYTIHWMTTFHPNFLNQAHMLFICDGDTAHSSSELAAIKAFVAAGGGLFVVAAYGIYGTEADVVGNEFGLDQNNTGMLLDSDDQLAATPQYIWYNQDNFGTHPIMEGITRLELYWSSALDTIGTGTALVSTDADDTCSWSDGGLANGIPIIAALNHQLGRVVYSADSVFLAGYDEEGDGIQGPDEHDNILFLANIFQWLTTNHPPIVTVISPNGGEILEGATNSLSWTAVDPNKDLIVGYDILYSANGGGSWTPIAIGHSGTTINFDVSAAPEGDQYLIRVVAHDYELSGIDVSDATFSVESEGPTITNVGHDPSSPQAGQTVTVHADVTDVSGVAGVVCHYSTDGGAHWHDATMTISSGVTYECDIGSFAASATVQYEIEATDASAAGRTSISSTGSFTIPPTLTPPIPGFPIEAVAIGLLFCLGLIVLRRRRQTEVTH